MLLAVSSSLKRLVAPPRIRIYQTELLAFDLHFFRISRTLFHQYRERHRLPADCSVSATFCPCHKGVPLAYSAKIQRTVHESALPENFGIHPLAPFDKSHPGCLTRLLQIAVRTWLGKPA